MSNKYQFMKKSFIWVAVILALIMLACGLLFGKVIEETLFLEIAKWVVMYFVLLVIVGAMWYTVGQFIYDAWLRKKDEKDE